MCVKMIKEKKRKRKKERTREKRRKRKDKKKTRRIEKQLQIIQSSCRYPYLGRKTLATAIHYLYHGINAKFMLLRTLIAHLE